MSPHFKRVGLIGKASGERVAQTLQTLAGYLAGLGVEIRLDEHIAGLLTDSDHPVLDRTTLAQQCDLAIVVGGDGTLIGVARSLGPRQVPLISVNTGKLGFLTEFSSDELKTHFDRAVHDDALVSRRA